jgi:hypothetical protein
MSTNLDQSGEVAIQSDSTLLQWLYELIGKTILQVLVLQNWIPCCLQTMSVHVVT